MFGTTYELSLNRDYVRHWGVAEASRELIQNALDSDSPFVYEFIPDPEDRSRATLALLSENAHLSPQSLLLGATSKAEATDKIGSFGEGYKIALLVLTREGHAVEILNGDVVWKPYFQYSNKYKDDLLCIEEFSVSQRFRGVTFLVHGLDEEQCNAIRASCLQMQSHIGAIRQTKYGDLLLEKPGELYVGGLYICKTELKYGYNFKPEHMRLERDRKTVDGWSLKEASRDIWYETQEFDRIAQLIEEETPDVELAEWSSPTLLKEACFRLFKEKNPGKIVAASQSELQARVKEGMTNVIFVGGAYGALVQASPSYRSQVFVALPTPQDKLKDWLETNKYRIHAHAAAGMRELIEVSKNWRLK